MTKRPIVRYLLGALAALFAVGGPLAAQTVETVTYYHWDALGSPVAATDEQGDLKWREEYQPFGERMERAPAARENRRWYTGHPHDEATGLTYMGARWYEPAVGRFMAVDAVPFRQSDANSFNRY